MNSATAPAAPDSDDILLSSWHRPARSRGARPAGHVARILGLVAALGGALTTGYVGLTIVPTQLEAGRLLTDTPAAYQGTVYGAVASLLVWAACALAAMIAGTVGLARREPLGPDLTGVLTGLAAPVLWFAAFVIPVLAMQGLLL